MIRFLPASFDSGGVSVSPLGRRATIDSVKFRLPLAERLRRNYCFWIDRNITVTVYSVYKTSVMDVSVASLPRFANGRSSSLIRNYESVLLDLNDKINSELKKRGVSACFDSFNAEIIRLDTFVDLRFKNQRDKRQFYENAVKVEIPALPCIAEFRRGIYWHNNNTLKTSNAIVKLYDKRNFERKNKGEELNRNKLRLETSLQNKGLSKPLNDIVRRLPQPQFSGTVSTGNRYDAQCKNLLRVYENRHKSNYFSLINQDSTLR